jgi:protein TonB
MASTPPPGSFDRPSLLRRAWPLALIVALHVGFVLLLRDGLLQRIVPEPASTIVTAILFPPAAPPARPVAVTPPPKPAAPVPRTVVKPRPVVRKTAPKTPPPATATEPAAAPATTTVAPPAAEVAPAPASPPQSPPWPVARPVQPATVTSGVEYVRPPRPDYPAQSKRRGEEGRVVLRVLINEKGEAERIEIQKSSGYERLDEAAREAVQRAQFRPHREAGRPVPVYAIVPITFRLDQ